MFMWLLGAKQIRLFVDRALCNVCVQ